MTQAQTQADHRHRLIAGVKWLAAAALVGGLIWYKGDDFREKWDEIRTHGFAWGDLILAGLVFFLGLQITLVRWFVLVRAQGLPFRLVDAIRLGLVGFFFNNFMPGSVGGDVFKATFLAREQQKRTIAIATIVVDRVIGLAGLVFLTAGIGAVYWAAVWDVDQLRYVLIFVWAVTAVAILAGLVLWLLPFSADPLIDRFGRLPKVGHVAAECLRCAELYRTRPGAVVVALALAIVGHVGFVSSFYFCSLAMASAKQPAPPLTTQFLLVPIGMVVQSVPLTPGNVGVSETTLEYLFKLKGASGGALANVAQRLVNWAVALIGLVCYLPLRNRKAAARVVTLPPAPAPADALSLEGQTA